MKMIGYIFFTVFMVLAFSSLKNLVKKDFHNKREYWLSVALDFVTTAEYLFNHGTGTYKREFVCSQLYKQLPFFIQLILKEDELLELIEDAVNLMKQQLNAVLKEIN